MSPAHVENTGLTPERLVSLAEARGTLSQPPIAPIVQGPLEGKHVQGFPKVTMMMDGSISKLHQSNPNRGSWGRDTEEGG